MNLLTCLWPGAHPERDDRATLTTQGGWRDGTTVEPGGCLMTLGSPLTGTTGPGRQPVVVTLPAEIDVTNSGQVYDTLARALRDGAVVLVADATGTTFCDCTGVTTLVRVHHQAAAAGAALRVAASPAVQRIIQLSGTDHLLIAHPTVAAALDGGQDPAASNGDRNRAAGHPGDPEGQTLPVPRPPAPQS